MKIALYILAILALLISPFLGTIELNDILNNPIHQEIFYNIRIPRTLLAFFTGATLALSGLIFQSLLRNPLTSPFTLGVASGATLGSAIAIVFSLTSFIYFFGFLGASLTVFFLFLFSLRLKKFSTNTLLLIGITLGLFYSSAILILFFLSDLQQTYEILRFTMGSLTIVGIDHVLIIGLSFVFLLLVSFYFKRDLKLLLTSYDNAFLNAVPVKKVVLILLLVVSLSVGVVVSITGPIGFIGLIVPHMVKRIFKKSAEKLLLETGFFGGAFLLISDMIGRSLPTLSEIPIGVITSFLGGPFFIYLLWKRTRDG